jgi:TetR/AcrR family transcriptional regulator, regulator of autoinduction and epiphytic fitness
VEAIIELMEEGELQPTTTAIAARAGVSERTIFQHFSERDSLFLAVAARQADRIRAEWERVPRTGPFDDRLDAFVAQRARILELVSPVRRGALMMEPFSEAVSEGLAGFRKLKREEAARVFAIELERLPDDERAAATAALGMVASWSAWNELRRHQGLTLPQARAALRRAIAGIVGA